MTSPTTLDIPPVKSASAFKTISEVSQETGVPQHVLRFWEAKFTQLRPLKRGGGRRYYRPEDVALLQRIRRLLHDEGYTIKGVQKVLREQKGEGVSRAPVMPQPAAHSFMRTRAAVAAGEAGSPVSLPSRLVLDVELLSKSNNRDQLLRDVLEDLHVIRRSLEDK